MAHRGDRARRTRPDLPEPTRNWGLARPDRRDCGGDPMIWLTWRQHRAGIGAFLALFGALAIFYLVDGAHLHHVFDHTGLAQCVGVRNDASCGSRRTEFIN